MGFMPDKDREGKHGPGCAVNWPPLRRMVPCPTPEAASDRRIPCRHRPGPSANCSSQRPCRISQRSSCAGSRSYRPGLPSYQPSMPSYCSGLPSYCSGLPSYCSGLHSHCSGISQNRAGSTGDFLPDRRAFSGKLLPLPRRASPVFQRVVKQASAIHDLGQWAQCPG